MKNILFLILFGILITSCQFDDDGNANNGGGNNTPVDPTNPAIPHNPSPEDGSTGVNNIVKFSWDAEGVDSFRVLFDDSNPPVDVGRKQIISNETTLFANGDGKNYYWQVISLLGNGSELAGPIWSFTTEVDQPTPPGFVMIIHSLTTEPPNKVKILFQVLDLEERGVTNLTASDFELFENGERISQLESNLSISRRTNNQYNLKTLLMLDNSTSIVDDDPTNLPKIKNASIDLVNGMDLQQEIAVYKFSSQPEMVIDFTGFSNQFSIISAINSINRGARSTNLYGAVIRGAQELTESFTANLIEQSYMILFTDGDDTQDSQSLNDALNAVAGKRVYTVGLGVDLDPEVLDLLGTEGYFQINETGELSQIFQEIQNDIIQLANSFYWLEYESPKRGNNEHLLNLFISDNQINSFIEGTFSSAGFFDAQPGVYFNTSFGNPIGNNNVQLLPNGSPTIINVQTYGGTSSDPPVYSWTNSQFLNYNDISAASDGSVMEISAKAGAPVGSIIQITVFDTRNGFSNTLNIEILPPPQPVVFFTDQNGNPFNNNRVTVTRGGNAVNVKVGTNNATQTPTYTWGTDIWLIYNFLNAENSEVEVSTFNNAPAGQVIPITVTDNNNGVSNIVEFVIL
jgi:hypothetical protein